MSLAMSSKEYKVPIIYLSPLYTPIAIWLFSGDRCQRKQHTQDPNCIIATRNAPLISLSAGGISVTFFQMLCEELKHILMIWQC